MNLESYNTIKPFKHMTYYIVFNEWNYPTESGREFIGDYDTRLDAEFAAKSECDNEEDNFLEVNNGEIYREACGPTMDEDFNCTGYVLNSSQDETMNHFFRSIIIKREV